MMVTSSALLFLIASGLVVDGFPQSNNGIATSGGQTTVNPEEPTTRIPPADPTNAVVFTVSCRCPFTYQYNPVCGSDGQTYGNEGVLSCARQCGKNVNLYLAAACGRNNG